MDNPLADQTSFVSSVRIFILQSAINKQSWRNAELINRLLEYLKDYLSHEFQNVRDKISSCLTTIFCKDIAFPNGSITNCPRVCDFFKHVMPKLNVLYESTIDTVKRIEANNHVDATSNKIKMITLDNNENKEDAIRLFKTGIVINLSYWYSRKIP